jgi:hypothetical protein
MIVIFETIVSLAMLFGSDRHLYRKYMISDSIHDRTNFNTASEQEIFGDRDFPSWLTQQQISRACTTYQTSRLMLIGAAPETNRISAFWRIFELSRNRAFLHAVTHLFKF